MDAEDEARIAILVILVSVIPSCEVKNASIQTTNETKNKKSANYECTAIGTLFVRKIFDIAQRRDKEITALSTLAIAVFTIVLAVAAAFQYCGIMASIGQARKAANIQALLTRRSIKLARDEFLSTHRPKIRIKHVVLGSNIVEEILIKADVTIINDGATDAHLQEFGIKFFIEEKGQLLPPVSKFDPFKTALSHVLRSGVSTTFYGFADGRTIKGMEGYKIGKGDLKLYCAGYFHYRDSADRVRTTAFCRVLAFPVNTPSYVDTGRFRMMDPKDPDYEYDS